MAERFSSQKWISTVRIFWVLIFLAELATRASAADFTISNASTTAQTLGSGAGQTGTVTAAGSLTVGGGTVAVTISGNTATLTNNGTIKQTGTGRAIRDNTGVTGLTVTNNVNALLQTADADVIQMAQPSASVTLNNYGTLTSLNASGGGAQAVDFASILSGGNVVNNFSTGLMQAVEADAVRPGVNGVVYNAGTIKSSTTTGSSSDGIDAQNNSGVQITNDTTGLIQGGRHGITGGALNNSVNFTMAITNNAGGSIQGSNGAGINLDGFNAKQTATVINHGTITGNGVTGDGDGIDVDGVINLTNSGVIKSINSFSASAPAQSEGVTVGGGTIVNSGTIEGDVAAGNSNAVGRGITIAGIDTSGTPEPIYSNTSITNSGLIKGQSDSGIAIGGGASGFTVTINNAATGVIEGGGTTAAIQTGADNDTVINAGTIRATGSGKAIDLGGGLNSLIVTGGAASIIGDISGGAGSTSSAVFDPGAGQTFSYAGAISNFSSVEIKSGTVKLFGASSYAGNTTISGGTLTVRNSIGSATGSGSVAVKGSATLSGDGRVGGNVSVEAGGFIAPGNGAGTLSITGNLSLVASSRLLFDLGANVASSDLLKVGGALAFSGSGPAVFDFTNNGVAVGTYQLLTLGSAGGWNLSNFAIGTHDGFSGNLIADGNSVSLVVTAIPEPTTTAAIFGLVVLSAAALKRSRQNQHGRPEVRGV